MNENKTAQAQPQQGDIFNQPQPQSTTQLAPKPNYGIANLKESLNHQATMDSFRNLLGEDGAKRFTSALINIVGQNDQLQKCDTRSIILAAGQSAALNLALNPSLGFAAVVPYGNKAQFQIMRNGWVELIMRSGLVAKLVNEVVYEGELKSANRFTEEYDFTGQRISNKVIGFMAYAKLTSGFEKTMFMSREEVMAHGQRYSKTFRKDTSLWKTNPEAMGLKTILKQLINKWLPKTEILRKAVESDQATFTQGEIGEATPEYTDNPQFAKKVADAEKIEVVEVDNVEAEEV